MVKIIQFTEYTLPKKTYSCIGILFYFLNR